MPHPVIALIGAGPRGVSLIERLGAWLSTRPAPPPTLSAPSLTLHVIDDSELGAGRIWDTSQTRTLCMNTLAGAVTLFTEPGASVGAPIVEGPTLYEWVRLLRGDNPDAVPAAHLATYRAHPPRAELATDFAEELAATVPQSHPSRALYGAYISWVYQVALARLPESVTVVLHRARAVGITPDAGRDLIRLSDTTVIRADHTVLATGWTPPGPTAEEVTFAASGSPYVGPDNPLDQDLSALAPGSRVLVRGLGMGFFDLMALVTIDRGGRFVPDPAARSGLRYEPSGREPILLVGSGRGYPFLPKSDYGGLPPKAALPRLRQVTPTLDYDTVWPAVIRDAYEAYYRTLSRVRPAALRVSIKEIVALIETAASIPALNKALADATDEPFDLDEWILPLAGVRGSVDELTAHIAARLVDDIRHATLAADSPLKAALWSISASRKPSQLLGMPQTSRKYATVMAVGQMAGSGPPLFRTRQLLALIDAHLVHLIGAHPKPTAVAGGWEASSASSTEVVRADVLVDAFMHSPDIRRPADPLFSSLGTRIRPFAGTGSPEVDPATRRIVHADGTLDQRVHIIGIPTYGQLPDTTISPMPGVDSLLLRETDATAADVLREVLGE